MGDPRKLFYTNPISKEVDTQFRRLSECRNKAITAVALKDPTTEEERTAYFEDVQDSFNHSHEKDIESRRQMLLSHPDYAQKYPKFFKDLEPSEEAELVQNMIAHHEETCVRSIPGKLRRWFDPIDEIFDIRKRIREKDDADRLQRLGELVNGQPLWLRNIRKTVEASLKDPTLPQETKDGLKVSLNELELAFLMVTSEHFMSRDEAQSMRENGIG